MAYMVTTRKHTAGLSTRFRSAETADVRSMTYGDALPQLPPVSPACDALATSFQLATPLALCCNALNLLAVVAVQMSRLMRVGMYPAVLTQINTPQVALLLL